MNWQIAASAFAGVFLAELGDKTQIAAVTLTATSNEPVSVFVGASAALVLVTLFGVAAGAALGEALTVPLIRRLGALAFIAIGVAMLAGWL